MGNATTLIPLDALATLVYELMEARFDWVEWQAKASQMDQGSIATSRHAEEAGRANGIAYCLGEVTGHSEEEWSDATSKAVKAWEGERPIEVYATVNVILIEMGYES